MQLLLDEKYKKLPYKIQYIWNTSNITIDPLFKNLFNFLFYLIYSLLSKCSAKAY